MTLQLGNKMGAMGAKGVTGFADKTLNWAKKQALRPVYATGRGIKSGATGLASTGYRKADSSFANKFGWSPLALKKAWKDRTAEQKHFDEQAINKAAGTTQDRLNAGFSVATNTINPFNLKNRGKLGIGKNTDKTDHRFEQRRQQQQAYVKEITAVSDASEIVIDELRDALAAGNEAKMEAAIAILTKNNDLNDLLLAMGSEYGATTDAAGNVEVSSENARKVLLGMYQQMGVEGDDLGKSLRVISDQAMASGNYAFGGLSKYVAGKEGGHGHFRAATAEEQAGAVVGKFNNLEAQKQAQVLHPDTLFKRTENGFTDMNGEVADAMVRSLSKATADQSNRSRADMRKAIQDAWEGAQRDPSAYKGFIDNFNDKVDAAGNVISDNGNFRYYVAKMLQQNGISINNNQNLDQFSDVPRSFTEASSKSTSSVSNKSEKTPEETVLAAEVKSKNQERKSRQKEHKENKARPAR
jgi:hypothetical protein